MATMVIQFIRTFVRAIRLEMEAMRNRLGSFEIPLSGGEPVPGEGGAGVDGIPRDSVDPGASRHRYLFRAHRSDDKLVVGVEGTYRSASADVLVEVVGIDGTIITLESPSPLDLASPGATLVIYPWFLYERLIAALESLGGAGDDRRWNTAAALRAFGKGSTHRIVPRAAVGGEEESLDPPEGLNEIQREAVARARGSDLFFIWGPPGTGKTTTLVGLLETLRRDGERVLVTSTTNAAVDQVAATAGRSSRLAAEIAAGRIVRVGAASVEAAEVTIASIRRRHAATGRTESDRLIRRIEELSIRIGELSELLDRLRSIGSDGQLGLFEAAPDDREVTVPFERLLGRDAAARQVRDREPLVVEALAASKEELAITRSRVTAHRSEAVPTDRDIVSGATVVLATMAGLYVGELLARERFDTVVVEEAGMAILPAVFYCACLASTRVVFVGDPRQLPPIVQSDSPYVKRAMGRSIFEVTLGESLDHELLTLLSLQYRMHPAIASIVSRVFYDGRLVSDPSTAAREAIASLAPFPGKAVAVVDVSGTTICRRESGGSSRLNEESALRCVELAAEAIDGGIESVGIITPYAAQAKHLRKLVTSRGLRGVECSTVHRFQGHERDLIIFDCTDAPPMEPGVLLAGSGFERQSANLLNVSISRARGKFLFVADVGYFASRKEFALVNRLLATAGSGDHRNSDFDPS